LHLIEPDAGDIVFDGEGAAIEPASASRTGGLSKARAAGS
jgi:hypothetical protein